MGKIRTPLSVKLFIGMLSPLPSLFDACAELLAREYGPIDLASEILQWESTNYYRDEMGTGIKRKFIFFERLIDPGSVPAIKTFTNGLEQRFADADVVPRRRRINLDPGYVTEAKVVLATTKDFSHRVYIGSGIFAEVTLAYSLRDRRFVPFEYTYPDYRTDDYRKMFHQARQLLRASLHANEDLGSGG